MMVSMATAPSTRRRVVVPAAVVAAACTLVACGGAPSTTSGTTAAGTATYRWGVVGNAGKIARLELDTPTVVRGVAGRVVELATSNSDSYVLTTAGDVWAWGVGSAGELGDGRTVPYDTDAVRVDFTAGVRIVALANPMPFDGALAIDSRGRVWGWGLNGDGDLCLSGGRELRPARLPLRQVTLATGARTHSLFDAGGRVYACGSGDAGELGNGTTTSSPTPIAVVGLPTGATVTALTSSWEGSGALLRGGAYYNWGYNAAGQLGDGTTANRAVPVRVDLPAPVRQVSQGGSGPTNGQTVAVLTDGAVWAWGNNERGQIGIGNRVNAMAPVAVDVPKGVTFVKVNAGGYACYAIDSSGRLWAWGGNENGQLGTGSGPAVETVPVDVGLHLTQVSSTASNVAGFRNGAPAG
jgi:alpha-tubulin suppressor-like RCC1 family protein